MKLLYVTDALTVWGGMEKVLSLKVNFFMNNCDYKVMVLTTNQGGHAISFPFHHDVSLKDLDIHFQTQYQYCGWARWRCYRSLHVLFRKRLKDVLKNFCPDIIICLRVEYVSDIVSVKGHIPLVFESHSTFWTSRFEGSGVFRRFHTLWMNMAVRKVAAVVALTEGDSVIWRKLNKSVYVIPNVAAINPTESFSNCLSKTAMFVGRLSRQKGIERLLDIWNQVHKRYPEWRLHIYGERGDIEETLYQKLLDGSIGVVVHNPIEDIIDEYKKHSILLLTSWYEPFGLVLPEAMSCGLPVVAFDCPYGPADIISPGKDGFLIRDNCMSDYADKVCNMIENEELRQTMGKAGSESARRYSAAVIMPLWDKLFKDVLVGHMNIGSY